MAANTSALQKTTLLGRYVGRLLSHVDTDMLDRKGVQLIVTIKQLLADGRLDVRDYEMAENRAEMTRHGKTALERLDAVRINVLQASEQEMFSPIEVAEITTELEVISAEIKESL